MNEGAVMAQSAQSKGFYPDTMSQMTCGQNLERKIAEQQERLSMLKAALDEMKSTGLYNVKISTLRDTMTF